MSRKRLYSITAAIIGIIMVVSIVIALVLSGANGYFNPNTSNDSSSNTGLTVMKGISAVGEVGKEPKIEFKTPYTIKKPGYAILQQGNGKQIVENDRLCIQQIDINARTGKQLANTWGKPELSCSLVVNNEISPDYQKVFTAQKVGATIAIGIPAQEMQPDSQGATRDNGNSSEAQDSFLKVMTIVSAEKALMRAQGTPVKNIPPNLPKVTLAENGAPSINIGSYTPPKNKLVVQPLIQGNGPTVQPADTVSVQYTGWLLDGKEFDSSWKRGAPATFNLQGGVIKGWTEGLTGQKVGSQVMLVIPPELAYGDKGTPGIPPNSTLIFVIDILSANSGTQAGSGS